MSWKEAFRDFLAQSQHLLPILAGRVRYGYRPQGDAYPAVTFFAISTTQGHTLDAADGLPLVRIQVDCWGRTAKEADTVREAVRLSCDGFRGDMRGVFVQSCLISEGGRDTYEQPQDGSDRGPHLISIDVLLAFEETVPTF